MNVKGAWHKLERDKRIMLIVVISILIIVLAGIAIYASYFAAGTCASYECFQKAMASCSKVSYINEASDASWGYTILGASNGDCVVRVKLLQAKQGTLNIDQLRGYYMDCSYPLGVSNYPESDLTQCHGRLKEELQGIIIQKLYAYIVGNIGQIGQNLKSAV